MALLKASLHLSAVVCLLCLKNTLVIYSILIDSKQEKGRRKSTFAGYLVLPLLVSTHNCVYFSAVITTVFYIMLNNTFRGPCQLLETLIDTLVEFSDVIGE
mmetsp:Transcript_28579/g.94688  ORF Transcript_28579/g.94688 Transcript_28579/m.94688 type:complete len:101 (+) Transcript_28579:1327-1629(+)